MQREPPFDLFPDGQSQTRLKYIVVSCSDLTPAEQEALDAAVEERTLEALSRVLKKLWKSYKGQWVTKVDGGFVDMAFSGKRAGASFHRLTRADASPR